MKRRIVSAVLILVSLLSVSCKSQEITGLNGKELQKSQYKSFICDTELNETEIDLKVDYWREPVKFKNLESKHFCFEGKNYELVYQSSTTEPYSPFEEDEYHDGDKSYFSFKSGTEEMTGFLFNVWALDMSDYQYVPITSDEAQIKAEEIASQYIELEDYVVTKEKMSYTDISEMNCDEYVSYKFKFIRHICGVPTMDRARVTIGNDGRLISFSFSTAGLFSGKENIDFDEKEVELSIAEKMKELFDSKYKYEYTQEKKLLTYTSKGELLLVSEVRAVLIPEKTDSPVNVVLMMGTVVG